MDSQENVKRRIAADGFFEAGVNRNISGRCNGRGTKKLQKKYGAQMHALLDAIRRQRQEREFSQQRNGSGKECFEEKSVRDSMMSGYESGQGKLWIVDNGKRAQELLEAGLPGACLAP